MTSTLGSTDLRTARVRDDKPDDYQLGGTGQYSFIGMADWSVRTLT